MIRLQKIINLNFKIDELKVQNTDGKNIGSIKEYVFSDSSFEITKIYVAEKSLKSKILDKVVTVKRSQIVKLSNQKIVVGA